MTDITVVYPLLSLRLSHGQTSVHENRESIVFGDRLSSRALATETTTLIYHWTFLHFPILNRTYARISRRKTDAV